MSAKNASSSATAAHSTQHATFVIDRAFAATPSQVFAAWSSAQAKSRWFAAPSNEWNQLDRELDFRVGGRERLRGCWASGVVTDFQATYNDIVADQRIVYTYSMHLDERKISVSLATVEFKPANPGTRVIVTEQGAFLDGYDDSGARERGTRALLEQLAASLGG
ncbi:MAG: SRPBCC family protein [Rudaea sp.]